MHFLKKHRSRLTVVGSLLVIVFAVVLSVTWANDGRWGWFALGTVLIVINIMRIVTELRPAPEPRAWTLSEVREVTDGINNEVNAIRRLRRADRGLSLEAAVSLVRQARSEGAAGSEDLRG